MHPTRIFKTPEELLKAWEDYKVYKDSQASKWENVQYVGKDGNRVTDKPPMPYDLDGFVSWYYRTYKHFIHQYFEDTESYGDGFLGIVTHIKSERNDNIKTGTLLGHFNSAIGIRIVGLADKSEVNTSSSVVLSLDPLKDAPPSNNSPS